MNTFSPQCANAIFVFLNTSQTCEMFLEVYIRHVSSIQNDCEMLFSHKQRGVGIIHKSRSGLSSTQEIKKSRLKRQSCEISTRFGTEDTQVKYFTDDWRTSPQSMETGQCPL